MAIDTIAVAAAPAINSYCALALTIWISFWKFLSVGFSFSGLKNGLQLSMNIVVWPTPTDWTKYADGNRFGSYIGLSLRTIFPSINLSSSCLYHLTGLNSVASSPKPLPKYWLVTTVSDDFNSWTALGNSRKVLVL